MDGVDCPHAAMLPKRSGYWGKAGWESSISRSGRTLEVVAIEVLRDVWLHPSRRDRFDSERRVLAQLNHPCIARLYDAATFPDGTPWFVMEYVEGMPVTEYCKRYKCTIDRKPNSFGRSVRQYSMLTNRRSSIAI